MFLGQLFPNMYEGCRMQVLRKISFSLPSHFQKYFIERFLFILKERKRLKALQLRRRQVPKTGSKSVQPGIQVVNTPVSEPATALCGTPTPSTAATGPRGRVFATSFLSPAKQRTSIFFGPFFTPPASGLLVLRPQTDLMTSFRS